MRGVLLWAGVGVWVGLVVTLTHGHSTYTDLHFNPYRYQTAEGQSDGNNEAGSDLSDHLALEFVGSEEEAKRLADKYHLHYLRQVFVVPPVYHLHRPRDSRRWSGRREKRSTTSDLVNLLSQEPGVTWVDQQRAYARDKRDRRIIPSDVRHMRALLDNLLSTRRGAGQAEGRVGEDGSDRELRDWAREEDIRLGNIRAEEGERREGVDGNDRNLREQAREEEIGLRNIRVGQGGHVTDLDKKIGIQTNGRIKGRLLDDSAPEEDIEPEDIFSEERGQIANLDREEGRKTNDWIKRTLAKDTEPNRTTKSSSLPNVERKVGGTGVGKGHLSPATLRNLTDSSFRKSFGTFTRRQNQSPKSRQLNKKQYVAKYTDESPFAKSSLDVGSAMPGSEESPAGGNDVGIDSALEFNDPLYRDQWYLVNQGQGGSDVCDLNVTWSWRRGYTGKGITVSILDDGVQTTNQDIHDNYAPEVSYSVVKDSLPLDDPSPRLDPPIYSNSHGTYCAGVVAAVADNGVCGVGVAYKARVGGVRIVDGSVTDIQEATALSRHINTVDVFSASWGPPDDGTKVEGPEKLARQAFEQGVTQGRGGLGVIYVWACGNGGLEGDNCNLDGYASSVYTLSVAALTEMGASTFYEEPCASTMAGVYVGGSHTLINAMRRDSTHEKAKRVVVPELDGHCSQRFQGSSAAAPLMSGVIALVLQANSKLGWRDVQHLVARLATPTPEALKERGWSVNSRGRAFHLMQGFGAVDAGRLVEAALTWQSAGPQQIVNVSLFGGSRPMQPHTCMNISGEVDRSSSSVTSLEHVVATISINHPERRLLEIFLTSPAGTQSQVLTNRPKDQSGAGFNSWKFMSVHFWGEDPRGEWRVAVRSDSRQKGYLKKILLQLYGT